jgi:hypothetical protein
MWFRRRDMGYAKSLKEKIWTHEGPSTKRKNDEHMKAHVLKNIKDSHVLKIKTRKRERSFMLKEYSVNLPFSTHMHILI